MSLCEKACVSGGVPFKNLQHHEAAPTTSPPGAEVAALFVF